MLVDEQRCRAEKSEENRTELQLTGINRRRMPCGQAIHRAEKQKGEGNASRERVVAEQQSAKADGRERFEGDHGDKHKERQACSEHAHTRIPATKPRNEGMDG